MSPEQNESPEQLDNPPTSSLIPNRDGLAADDQPLDIVDEASMESFPASDAPSWTFGIERGVGSGLGVEGKQSL